jgi:hypothetical protein
MIDWLDRVFRWRPDNEQAAFIATCAPWLFALALSVASIVMVTR